MDAGRVIEAAQRHLVRPGETIEGRKDWPNCVDFRTSSYLFEARPANWLICREPWVAEAVLVVADRGIESMVETYGFLFGQGGEEWFLNDVNTMRGLGRRLGADLDPVAYAELLAEFYSGTNIDGPVVHTVSMSVRAGELVRDVAAFVEEYPFVDPGLVAPPLVDNSGDGVSIEFHSSHYLLSGYNPAVDILGWTVTGGGGRPASWSREYVAKRLTRP